jgi:hypothetical protein
MVKNKLKGKIYDRRVVASNNDNWQYFDPKSDGIRLDAFKAFQEGE